MQQMKISLVGYVSFCIERQNPTTKTRRPFRLALKPIIRNKVDNLKNSFRDLEKDQANIRIKKIDGSKFTE